MYFMFRKNDHEGSLHRSGPWVKFKFPFDHYLMCGRKFLIDKEYSFPLGVSKINEG